MNTASPIEPRGTAGDGVFGSIYSQETVHAIGGGPGLLDVATGKKKACMYLLVILCVRSNGNQ